LHGNPRQAVALRAPTARASVRAQQVRSFGFFDDLKKKFNEVCALRYRGRSV
jgi:hypothetical protein